MEKRQRRSQLEGSELIRRYYKDKQTVSDFCQSEGISQAGFYLWKKRYGNQKGVKSKQKEKFYPLTLTDTPSSGLSGLILSYPSGVQLRIEGSVELGILKQLLRLV